LVELSRYLFEQLRQDDDSILYRGQRTEEDSSPILIVAPASEQLGPESLKRFEREFYLRDELDPAWAAPPLAISFHWNRPVLVLSDPGGMPLELTGEGFGRSAGEGAFDLGFRLRIGVNLAAAIGQLHQRGIIHKGIRPANILFDSATGRIRLTGFGIASRLPRERQSPDSLEFTTGTLAYMAPEQTGRMNRSTDSRSDLYSFGVTLYQLLTGSLPFSGSDAIEWIHCHIARRPTPPHERDPEIPEAVSAVVMRLLAKTAEDRYQTAAGVEFDLKQCLAEWQQSGHIDSFAIGERDASDRLRIPERLYGREQEVKVLLGAFDRVVTKGTPELVLVTGYSGIGKSSVVNELHQVLVQPRGLFASGKFDWQKRDIPYSTLAQALEGLVRPLLGKSDAELNHWRETLQEALNPNGRLIIDLVPELAVILGEQPPVPEVPPQDAQRRFQLTFRRFISVFARSDHPLALFLDDLQWLDTATLDLIEDLLTQPDVRYLLLIGAYRNNEVGATHPLLRKLETIRRAGAAVHDIHLAPLTRTDLEKLTADSLRCGVEPSAPLALLVHEKTGGNPFFAIQFISTLAEEKLLTFDQNTGQWSWDLARIHAQGYTDNVVDLMLGKLNRLSNGPRAALKELACLGNHADVETLAIVLQTPPEEVEARLWEAVQQELIVPLPSSKATASAGPEISNHPGFLHSSTPASRNAYRFVHDRVQEAAYSLVPEERRTEAHLRMGRLLAAHTPTEKLEEDIFEIVNQFNLGRTLITTREESEQLAELNLLAGKRAKSSTAYVAALKYLVAGANLLADEEPGASSFTRHSDLGSPLASHLSVLTSTAWERHPRLAFSLELHRAECEFLTGELTAAAERLASLSCRAANTVDLATVTCLQVDLYTTLDQSDRAIDVCLEYLRRLGVEWSPQPTPEEARHEYERIWLTLRNRSIEELINLPLMDDPESLATLNVLARAVPPALFTNANLLCLAVCRMVNLSLDRGNSDASCFAYVHFAMVAGPQFGNYRDGFRFGQLGYQLVDQRGLLRFQARTTLCFALFVVPWTRHIRAGCDLLRRAFEDANKAGDLTFAAYSRNTLNTARLATGDQLADVQAEAEKGLEFAKRARFGLVIEFITTQLQLILTLRGLTPKFGSFDDADFNESQFERHFAGDPRLAIAECWYWVRKLQARFLAGDYTTATEAARNAQRLLWTSPSFFETAEYEFYSALALAAVSDSASLDNQAKSLAAIQGHQQQLSLWAKNCPENFTSRAALVGAEIARIQGRSFEAMRLYQEAIQSAREHGLIQNEAIAYEVAARFYSKNGFQIFSQSYLQNARHCYLRWGALGKVRQLDADLVLPSEVRTVSGSPRPETALEQLELDTVIKVSEAVSSEIVLEQLVRTLMICAVEHAGAERGLLILPSNEEYRIAAQARTGCDQVEVQVQELPVTAHDLPDSLFRYVIRTQQSVIIDDASSATEPRSRFRHRFSPEGTPARSGEIVPQSRRSFSEVGNLFSQDPYVRQYGPRSILCLPLVKQTRLMGVLYLENNLAPNVFTAQRLAMLELLASQAAISLDHARLYADLIKENDDRKKAEEALRASEERWSMLAENSSAGIALMAPGGRFLAANLALQKMLGYTEAELQQRTISEITHEEDRAATEARVAKSHDGRRQVYRIEKRYLCKNGTTLWADVSSVFVPASDNSAAFSSIVIVDINKRKEAETELHQKEISLREAQNVLAHVSRVTTMGELAASIAHEVSQPISGIINNANAALRWLHRNSPDIGEACEAISEVVKDGDRTRDVIIRMRALFKKAPTAAEPVDINQIIQEVLSLTQNEIHKGHVSLITRFAHHLPAATGDRIQLQQVILNLVMNAIEAMNEVAEDERELCISSQELRETDTDSMAGAMANSASPQLTSILVAVQDSGPGLDPEELERIFGNFYTTKPQGLGMGLSISRSIVEAHQGYLWVTKHSPRGAVFQFKLPASKLG
jgi:PAS domain S-box-containing protein